MKKVSFLIAVSITAICSCNRQPVTEKVDPSAHVTWSRNATIYEVNIRQYTPQGTFKAFEQELPRLQKMGVDILWLMPINPLGEKNRKGSLGSYYSVSDYLSVNPEYGTKQDFVDLVKKAHELSMKVIVDWVANHTSWDNDLITKHPEWYKKDSTGNIVPPVTDWSDVAALDYSQQDLREYMTDALLYWIREADIDGYRCDVAGMMPVSFWHEAIPKLKQYKPVFMLAEDASPKMHDTGYFDATYSWDLFHMMNQIAQKKKTADKIDSLFAAEKKNFPADSYRMLFTSNHDENSWNGTEYERLGAGARTFAVLTFTFPGIPLVYSGQESAMNKRLRFFDKDTISWGNYPLESFYTTLMQLKKKNDLIASGDSGGRFIKVGSSNDKSVYAFLRKKGIRQIFVILNFSDTDQTVVFKGSNFTGKYRELFTSQEKEFRAGDKVALSRWQYLVYENE
ncbi:MAG: alpha-amylase family glycosyl hydrolase [Bacteroidales bacterium]|nr:alpha-amylase family glycosyl hydrolase [Bacteroidales bacterium]